MWRRAAQATRELEAAFLAEGNRKLWVGRLRETEGVLRLCEEGRSRRFRYLATVDER